MKRVRKAVFCGLVVCHLVFTVGVIAAAYSYGWRRGQHDGHNAGYAAAVEVFMAKPAKARLAKKS